jgi:hypothetical protein
MVEIVTPLSLWIQLGSFFFFMSGIFGDLLVIRFFLVLAYIMLLINAIFGSPLWPDLTGHDGRLALDSLCWAIIGLYVHGCSLWYLLLDEREVPLSEDEAALWRMLYRTGGLSQRLFHSIVACHLKVVEFQPGQEIPTNDDFYIVYTGQVKLEVYDDVEHKYDRIMVSGEMFDLNFLGLFSEKTVFLRTKIRCKAITRAKLFRIHRDDMKKIAQNGAAKGIRQALLINQLSFIVESYADRALLSRTAEKHDRIFEPLEAWEEPRSVLAGSASALKQPLAHLIFYVKASFSPPLPFAGHPIGIRQTLLPPPPEQGSYDRPEELPRFHYRRLFSHKTRRMTGRSTACASDNTTANEFAQAAAAAAAELTEVDEYSDIGELSC